MSASIAARWTLAALCTAASCLAQGRVSDFLNIQRWHGTIKITGSGSGTSTSSAITDTWQFGVTDSIDITLDTYDPNIQGWHGTFQGTSNISAQDVAVLGGCTETFKQSYQGPLGAGKTFTMHMQGSNQYVFYPSDYQVEGSTADTSNSCAPGDVGGTGPISWSIVTSDKVQTLPATGFSLTGSFTAKMDSPIQPMSLLFGGTAAQVDVTVTWDLEPGPAPQTVLVVQKTSDLMNWRPTAGAHGGRGNSVNLTAKLQETDGSATNARAVYFTWELTKSSREPGYCMNAEIDSPDPGFDLKLESGSDNLQITDPNGQKAQSPPGQYTQGSATLASYDWGAFGTIKVTAYLTDGTPLVGYLDGDPSQTDVRMPLRTASSLIADAWKNQHPEAAGLADISDSENSPVGDGHQGDGFTLYEEYRGFMVDGQHIEGDPAKKDFFVVNTIGQSYQPGINLFQQLSGLKVHANLHQNEMPLNHVMNHNHSEGAHVVDQHGVVIVPIAASADYAEAQGGPGTPGMISQIVAPAILPGTNSGRQLYLAYSLTHELFHACNVFHHGDQPSYITYLTRSSTGDIYASAVPGQLGILTNVITEAGTTAAPLLPLNVQVKAILGKADDTHTGNDNCVMRYDDSSGYFSKAGPGTIYYTAGETEGVSICTSGAGTGINDPNRTPQPRYGDAAPGRGDCLNQILVNDAIPAPRR
jgi:hypothetical protein